MGVNSYASSLKEVGEIVTGTTLSSKGGTPEVKLTSNLLCHNEESHYYKNITKHFEIDFDNIEQCVNSGFVLPNLYNKTNMKLWLKGQDNLKALKGIAKKYDAATQKNEIKEAFVNELQAASPEEISAAKDEVNNQVDFGGFDWNPALVFLGYNGSSYIEDVSIERANPDDAMGTIRAGKELDHQLALMVEAHYYWTWFGDDARQYGAGPFVSVSLASQEGSSLGSVLGVGAMFGTRKEGQTAFNFGIGYFRDTDFTRLRGGLSPGDMTTATDSATLIEKHDVGGWMLLFTANF